MEGYSRFVGVERVFAFGKRGGMDTAAAQTQVVVLLLFVLVVAASHFLTWLGVVEGGRERECAGVES